MNISTSNHALLSHDRGAIFPLYIELLFAHYRIVASMICTQCRDSVYQCERKLNQIFKVDSLTGDCIIFLNDIIKGNAIINPQKSVVRLPKCLLTLPFLLTSLNTIAFFNLHMHHQDASFLPQNGQPPNSV